MYLAFLVSQLKRMLYMHKERTYKVHTHYTLCVDIQHIFTSGIRQHWFIFVGITTESLAFLLLHLTDRQGDLGTQRVLIRTQ